MSSPKLLLWDIDGTLIVSHGAGFRAMQRALRERFGREVDLRQINWAGRTDSWIVAEVLRHVGLPDSPENTQAYLEAYLTLLPVELRAGPSGQLLPGVAELLAHVHGRTDVVQGLLTGNMVRGAELKLSHFNVWHYFRFGAFADDSPRRNDLGPVALQRAHSHHGRAFAPEHTFIIGDTPHDIECGQVIGAQTVAVATGHYSLAELEACRPTAAFANLADTTAFLRLVVG